MPAEKLNKNSNKYKSAKFVIFFYFSQESQTKVLLGQVIFDVHQDFGLGHKVVATTTDNGANYVAAFKHFGVEGVPVEGREEEEDLEEVVIGRPADVHDQLEDEGEETLLELPKHYRCAAHTINLMATVDIEKVNGWNSGLRCVAVM